MKINVRNFWLNQIKLNKSLVKEEPKKTVKSNIYKYKPFQP